MKIELKKFGTILVSRQLGREAYAAFLPSLKNAGPKEKIEVDFSGVDVLSPSWADEFLTPLNRQFGERLALGASDNRSVMATVEMLEKANKIKFTRR
jgi:hypothetical protein